MRRTTRTTAAALALAVALGAGAPVAAATAGHGASAKAAQAKAAQAKADHAKAGRSDKKGAKKPGHSKGAKKVQQAQRDFLRAVEKVDDRLAHVARASRVSGLAEAERAAVLANVAEDRLALAELLAAAQAGDGIADRSVLKDLRPQNYNKAVNALRVAAELAAQIAVVRAQLEGDPSAPVWELDTAQSSVDAAVAGALLIDATSDKAALRAVRADLEAAQAALEVATAYLESRPDEDEPVVDEPVVDEPVE